MTGIYDKIIEDQEFLKRIEELEEESKNTATLIRAGIEQGSHEPFVALTCDDLGSAWKDIPADLKARLTASHNAAVKMAENELKLLANEYNVLQNDNIDRAINTAKRDACYEAVERINKLRAPKTMKQVLEEESILGVPLSSAHYVIVNQSKEPVYIGSDQIALNAEQAEEGYTVSNISAHHTGPARKLSSYKPGEGMPIEDLKNHEHCAFEIRRLQEENSCLEEKLKKHGEVPKKNRR